MLAAPLQRLIGAVDLGGARANDNAAAWMARCAPCVESLDPGQATVQRHVAAVAFADAQFAPPIPDGAVDQWAARKNLDGLYQRHPDARSYVR